VAKRPELKRDLLAVLPHGRGAAHAAREVQGAAANLGGNALKKGPRGVENQIAL